MIKLECIMECHVPDHGLNFAVGDIVEGDLAELLQGNTLHFKIVEGE